MVQGSCRGSNDFAMVACRACSTLRENISLRCEAKENHSVSYKILKPTCGGDPATRSDFPGLVASFLSQNSIGKEVL